jgi:hypothetical protein
MTLTPEIVNDSSFGISYWAAITFGDTAFLDGASIEVFYTEATADYYPRNRPVVGAWRRNMGRTLH